jgi:hypothetical protein
LDAGSAHLDSRRAATILHKDGTIVIMEIKKRIDKIRQEIRALQDAK